MKTRTISLSAALTLGCLSFGTLDANNIGYVEKFSLAKDRDEALKQLIPGTRDYYYYHALHYQNVKQFNRVDTILEAWIKRHKYSPRVHEILNRQALLTYGKNSKRSLAYLQNKLDLRFNHQREVLSRKPNLRAELDHVDRVVLCVVAAEREERVAHDRGGEVLARRRHWRGGAPAVRRALVDLQLVLVAAVAPTANSLVPEAATAGLRGVGMGAFCSQRPPSALRSSASTELRWLSPSA